MTITPGTTPGWTATPVPPAQGLSTDTGYTEQPIARWEDVNFVTYSSSTKTVALMALHGCGVQFGDEGIAKIEFIANNGPVATVTAPSINPATGRWDWWANLAPMATDGPVEIRAIIYPHAGIPRVLQGSYVSSVAASGVVLPGSDQSLVLKSNAQGTLAKPTLWVSTTGSDSTGNGTQAKPYATIQKAVETGYANAADYGTIYLTAGTYVMYRSALGSTQNSTGWLTIMPAPGVTRDQVIFTDGTGPAASTATRTKLLHIENVTLSRQASATGIPLFRGPSTSTKTNLWFDGCKMIGTDTTTIYSDSTAVLNSAGGENVTAITNSAEYRTYWQFWDQGPRAGIVIGVDTFDTGADCYTNDPFVRDFVTTRMVQNPGDHPDLWQSYSAGSNRIMMDGKAVECQAQLYFMDSMSSLLVNNTEIAFVNIALKRIDGTVLLSHGPGPSKHVIMWNNELINQGFLLNDTSTTGVSLNPLYSCHGCIWNSVSFQANDSGHTTAYVNAQPGFKWSDNFYQNTSWTPGTGALTGDPGYTDVPNGNYRPTKAGTTTRTVRWDINQSPRAATTLRGAYAAASENTSSIDFITWEKGFFTPAQMADPNTTGPNAKPQKDGISNVLKFLCDINPTQPMSETDKAALPKTARTDISGTNYLTLNYRQKPSVTGLTVNIQTSTDLQTWSTVTPDITQNGIPDPTTGDPTIIVGVKTGGVANQYIRLSVTVQ